MQLKYVIKRINADIMENPRPYITSCIGGVCGGVIGLVFGLKLFFGIVAILILNALWRPY